MKNLLFLSLLLLLACGSSQKFARMSAIDAFRMAISGDFDNAAQVEAERRAGQQVHPYARHVNRIGDAKIQGAPARDGFWIIEESYYDYSNKPQSINHHLFFFEAAGKDQVRLYAYELPADLPMAKLTNDNPDLQIDYAKIKVSPKFKPAEYQFSEGKFTLNAPNDLGNGMKFTLIETIAENRLEVMELLEKDGKRLTAYATPIIYDRIKK